MPKRLVCAADWKPAAYSSTVLPSSAIALGEAVFRPKMTTKAERLKNLVYITCFVHQQVGKSGSESGCTGHGFMKKWQKSLNEKSRGFVALLKTLVASSSKSALANKKKNSFS